MYKCKDGTCDKYGDDRCCYECEEKSTCKNNCLCDPKDCNYSEEVTTDVALFQSKALLIMQTIANIDQQKKILEERDKAVRKELQDAMSKYGVTKFENNILKITYVEPTTRTTIDSARLKKELPAVAEKYSKVSQVKGSVRIEVK